MKYLQSFLESKEDVFRYYFEDFIDDGFNYNLDKNVVLLPGPGPATRSNIYKAVLLKEKMFNELEYDNYGDRIKNHPDDKKLEEFEFEYKRKLSDEIESAFFRIKEENSISNLNCSFYFYTTSITSHKRAYFFENIDSEERLEKFDKWICDERIKILPYQSSIKIMFAFISSI